MSGLSGGELAWLRDLAARAADDVVPGELMTGALLIGRLLADLDEACGQLAITRAGYAELLATVRAAVAAEREGCPDPLGLVRGVASMRRTGQPAGGPLQVMADAGSALALVMAGCPS